MNKQDELDNQESERSIKKLKGWPDTKEATYASREIKEQYRKYALKFEQSYHEQKPLKLAWFGIRMTMIRAKVNARTREYNGGAL